MVGLFTTEAEACLTVWEKLPYVAGGEGALKICLKCKLRISQCFHSGSVARPCDYRVLVLRPGVRPEPLRLESRVQDTGPPETSWPHVISIGEKSRRDLRLNAKTQLHPTASKLQCWKPHAKQLARQEHNPTH